MGTVGQRRTDEAMGVIVSNVAGRLDTGIVIAGVRCGAKGLLNVEAASAVDAVAALARVAKFAGAGFGVQVNAGGAATDAILEQLPAAVEYVVVSGAGEKAARLKSVAAAARKTAKQVFLEVSSAKQAAGAAKAGFDAVIARGGEEATFALLPAVLAEAKIPVWAAGGVGIHTASGYWAAGAAGVVLDAQLLLTPQSELPARAKEALQRGETGSFGADAALAAPLASHYANVAGIVNGMKVEAHRHLEAAAKMNALVALPAAGLAKTDPAGLKAAIQGGAKAFALEGGAAAWEPMITALFLALEKGAPASEMTAVLAGGITDAVSAAMAGAMAAPLAAKGMKVGLQVEGGDASAILSSAAEILKTGGAPAAPKATTWDEKPADIAIVGMSCILPKAPDIETLWRNLLESVDAIDEIPANRFDYKLYFDADKKVRDKIYSKWGGFLDPVPFDPMKFGIPPASLNSIDPMQLLALVGVENALRDAGYDRREYNRERTSVILGISGGLGEMGVDYAFRSNLPLYVDKAPEEVLKQVPEWTEDSFAGLLPNVAAGRVANRFNFGGTNFIVDAACASSLTAAYVATRELNAGACDMVVVGGVDATQNPFGFLCFSKAQALSPRGRCRPFDSSADGIAIAEGVTMLVLKRLADAERDGDRIYSVIKGIAASSDGRGKSMTAPRLEGQILALRRAYKQAGVDSSTIGLIEAHGTGTTLGDTTEIGALDTVFRSDKAAPHTCAVGSIKSMVGHTKSAAGATSLMKVALALHHKVLPPTLHVEKQNPKLREDGTPFFVCKEPQPFLPPAAGVPRRAGISSFGFGGTNFHALLEEYQGDYSDPRDHVVTEQWPAELFLWNADGAEALGRSLGVLEAALARPAVPSLRDLALSVSSLADMKAEKGLRLAIVAGSHQELRDRVAAAKAALVEGKTKISDNKGLYLAPAGPQGKLAFLFPGQGSQYPNMLHDLAVQFAEFRLSLEAADVALAGKYEKRISSLIYPPSPFLDEDKTAQMQAITDTVVAQPALGIVEIALAKLLGRLGVKPDMTAGHSYGEYVALAAAGVFDEEALFRLSEARGRAIKDTVGADSGTMAAVSADAASVEAAVAGIDVVIANYNSPRQTIIAGGTKAVEQALERLKEKKLAARGIPVACAFHSPLMRGAAEVLQATLGAQKFEQPNAVVYSNTNAAPYPADTNEIGALLTKHLTSSVRFTDQIRAMYEDGARVFLEVGPKGVLSGLTRQILDGKECVIIQTETSAEKPGIPQWLQSLAQLAVNGVAFEVDELFRGRAAQRLDLASLPAVGPKPGWAMTPTRIFAAGKQPMVRSTPVSLAPQVVERVVEKVVEKIVDRVVEKPVPVAGPAAAAGPGVADSVLLQFQTLMGQFLETQSSIMSAYLTGGSVGVAPALPVAMPAPVVASARPITAPPAVMAPPPGMKAPAAVVVAPPPTPPPPAPAPVAAPAPAPAAAPATASLNVAAELLKIASDRTGYPADMLDVNAGIESDLGIDSIKRVEILTGFQKLCKGEQQAAVQGVMEKLTSAKTLKEIVERLTAAIGSAPAAAAPAPVVAAPVVAAPVAAASALDVGGELLKIASDRTGYPADMLDLNAGIESDLGIDSIKRVEILTGFQKLCTGEQQAAVQGVMEKLTSAKTLKEIIERLTAVVGGSSAPAAPVAAAPPAPVAAAASSFDVAGELLKIASDRTGYPADMLDLNAGIESDLGIDSIKRVEILTGFQKLCSGDQQAAVQGVMEKLTSAKTLKEIIERLTAAVGGSSAPAAPVVAAAPAPVTAAASSFDVAGELLKIASDRTGYPADMLDLNAGIESDLGIDSIKRVEILTGFQKLCTGEQQAAVQGVMEKLTSAKTLKEIIERLTAVVGGGTAPAAPVAAATPAPVAASRFDVAGELLKIASDRTGYPADMLDLNAGIESDLGIDSIKRVEILSEFQKMCSPDQQVGMQGVMDKLTSARTLREVIDRITEAMQPAAEPERSVVPRFRMAPVEKKLAATAPRYVAGRVCLITDDETGLAAGIAEEHQRGGEKVMLLRHSPGSGIVTAEGVISADLTDAATIDKIIEQVRTTLGPVGALIHLLPMRAGLGTIEDSLTGWRDHVRQDVRSLYALARASEADLKKTGHGLVVVVTARGGYFGYEPAAAVPPTHHGVADFIKTLTLEFTGVPCKVIDIDPTDPVAILRRKIADEIVSGDDTLQVGLPGDKRLTVLPEHAPVNGETVRPITKDWVILLTGGARGITAGVALKLAERWKPTLILAGASPLPPEEPAEFAAITDRGALKAAVMQKLKAAGGPVKPADVEAAYQRLLKDREIRASVQQIRDAGSKVSYHSLDVRDEAAMKSLIEGIYAEYGRLDAVIHGAGIIEDKLLKDKTPESFDRVVHTKTDSSWLLSRLLKPEGLQILIFMSSITAAFGNRAQADYAIANGVMNGYATKLAAEWPGRVVAMNWGPWDQHGMVTDEVRRQFLSRGIHMIPVDGGVESVLREMERGAASDAVVAFGAGPWGDIAVPDGTAQSHSSGATV